MEDLFGAEKSPASKARDHEIGGSERDLGLMRSRDQRNMGTMGNMGITGS
jgi:hypothetical protein